MRAAYLADFHALTRSTSRCHEATQLAQPQAKWRSVYVSISHVSGAVNQ